MARVSKLANDGRRLRTVEAELDHQLLDNRRRATLNELLEDVQTDALGECWLDFGDGHRSV